ncbi:hypothetical protein [Micromonospora craterilacus]|uniref:hypothetical protein n=1 Tax=Micromonospora craterilacus TaxID=1655439 RepID=UPI0011B54560|nr:hypothetical protein [Micromonospora craterilacus]
MKASRRLGILAVTAATSVAMLIPATPAQAATECTTLWLTAGSADVCKSYSAVGGGYYDGYVEVKRANSRVSTQVYLDGSIYALTYPGKTGRKYFSYMKKVHIRACIGEPEINGKITSNCGIFW